MRYAVRNTHPPPRRREIQNGRISKEEARDKPRRDRCAEAEINILGAILEKEEQSGSVTPLYFRRGWRSHHALVGFGNARRAGGYFGQASLVGLNTSNVRPGDIQFPKEVTCAHSRKRRPKSGTIREILGEWILYMDMRVSGIFSISLYLS